jgi:hypothetical protein
MCHQPQCVEENKMSGDIAVQLSEYHAGALTGLLNREIVKVMSWLKTWEGKSPNPGNADSTREYLEQLNTLVRAVDAARMKERT